MDRRTFASVNIEQAAGNPPKKQAAGSSDGLAKDLIKTTSGVRRDIYSYVSEN
jgi:hypothetical protein